MGFVEFPRRRLTGRAGVVSNEQADPKDPRAGLQGGQGDRRGGVSCQIRATLDTLRRGVRGLCLAESAGSHSNASSGTGPIVAAPLALST